jgi:hypothetical protein
VAVSGRAREWSWIYRDPTVVRAHGVNAPCLLVLITSGLQIFNAHPALSGGERSDFDRPLLSIYVAFTSEGRPIGIARAVCC